MKEFWDERYNSEEYAYGKEPNSFFRSVLEKYNPRGKIFLPAEGEGRNAVFAAKKGLEVTAIDFSEVGKDKALKLAEENGANIEYYVGDFDEFEFEDNTFDIIGLFSAHMPSEFRNKYYQKLIAVLKHGGLIIIEEFSKNHSEYQKINQYAGGPRDLDMLNSVEELRVNFGSMDILLLEEKTVEKQDGIYHAGKASMVRLIARKK